MSKHNNELVNESIVISGMSGRFPESDSTDHLADNMYKNFDLITEDDRRWPTSESKLYKYMKVSRTRNNLKLILFNIIFQSLKIIYSRNIMGTIMEEYLRINSHHNHLILSCFRFYSERFFIYYSYYTINKYLNILIYIFSYNNDKGLSGFNHRMGKLKEIDKLDCSFFGKTENWGNSMDPRCRILLETTYETIVDAG